MWAFVCVKKAPKQAYVKTPMYTLADVAVICALSVVTIRDRIRDGLLRAEKLGGRWMVTPEALQAFTGSSAVIGEPRKPKKRREIVREIRRPALQPL